MIVIVLTLLIVIPLLIPAEDDYSNEWAAKSVNSMVAAGDAVINIFLFLGLYYYNTR